MIPDEIAASVASNGSKRTAGRSLSYDQGAGPVADRQSFDAHSGEAGIRPLWRIEREAIEEAIERCGGNIPRAAVFLEVSPSTLYRKLQSWEKQGQKKPH